jgi:predicted transposase YbfD/YdcC
VHSVALSQLLTPERLAEVFRAQWSVENHLHRQLDVVFREDDARNRNNHGPANLSVIRRMALDIVPASPDNISLRRKINRARWDRNYLIQPFAYLR